MYLKHDLIVLAVAILWFLWGVRAVRKVPLIHDPMVTFSRYHPRIAPLVLFLLVVFWPVSKSVWRFVFWAVEEIDKIKKGMKLK